MCPMDSLEFILSLSLSPTSSLQGKAGDKGSLGFPGPPGPEVCDTAIFFCLALIRTGLFPCENKAQRRIGVFLRSHSQ